MVRVASETNPNFAIFALGDELQRSLSQKQARTPLSLSLEHCTSYAEIAKLSVLGTTPHVRSFQSGLSSSASCATVKSKCEVF